MKYLFLVSLVLFSKVSSANLYLQTEYQEGNKPKVVTKQHIFLNKKETINYTKKSYVLLLKKVSPTEATIESESYNLDYKGNKTMQGGSNGTYQVGKSFYLTEKTANGEQLFSLKIVLERVVKMEP